MKNIAIIGSLNYHLECISFLLEVFQNDSVYIYINNNTDIFKWIDYYRLLYKFQVIYNSFSSKIIHHHDLVFKLTSNDDCLDHENIISILHLNYKNHHLICKSKRFLSLTPYVKGFNVYTIYPIFNPIVNNSYNNVVTLIGQYNQSHFDEDTLNFININKHYTFNFIIWGSKNYSKLQTLENVKVYNRIETSVMMDIINNSKYILSKKYIYYDRFSGQLSLALSFEKPLIIDLITKNVYNLPGIPFSKNYSEIGNLDAINDEQYQIIKTNIKNIKTEMLKKNKLRLYNAFEIKKV
jgi:hypothetical protein